MSIGAPLGGNLLSDSAVEIASEVTPRRIGLGLATLFCASLLFWLDGSVLSIVIQPIEAEFHLSDTQIGLLSGLAYSVLSLIATIPLATLGDRRSHSWVLCLCMAVWSAMTMLCGAATGFVSLFLSRMGVGAGQAGGIPSIHALISTRLPRNMQARAFSLIGLTFGIGSVLGVSLGGVISDRWGWRWTLWLAGSPGLLLAVAVPLVIWPPKTRAGGTPGNVAVISAAQILFLRPTYRWIVLGCVAAFIGVYGSQAWTPTFLIRAFHLSATRAGLLYGACWGIVSMVGTMCGGMLVDWWARRDERAFVWILMLSYALTTPFLLIVYVTDHLEVAMSALSGAAFVFSLQLGPLYAVVQKLAGRKMRATAAALVVMVCGTAGTTCGPVAIGMLNEALHEFGAGPAIRLSMTAMLGTFVLAAWCYWKASHTARADFRVAEAE